MNKSYSELSKLKTLKERFDYLKYDRKVGEETFGYSRYMNQIFYKSKKWKDDVRKKIIVRDNGCECGLEGYPIGGRIIVHHINPITIEDIEYDRPCLYDPENLVCVGHQMHNAIEFSDDSIIKSYEVVERKPGDTCLWERRTI